MAEKQKKMSQVYDPASGVLKHTFGEAGELAVSLKDYPQNVVDYFAILGLKTAHRNATIGAEEEGSVGTPESMLKRLSAKVESWKAGILRAISGGEEKAPASTLILEAAVIYKKMKAAAAAGADVDAWPDFEGPDAETLRPEIEEMDDFVTNAEAVEKARAEALAKGEDGEDAAKKATITRLDLLKANKLFRLAMEAAKDARAQAKKAALKASIAKEGAGSF